MKHSKSVRRFLSYCSSFLLFAGSSAHAALSSEGSGEVAIYTQDATAGPAIAESGDINTNVLIHELVNSDREDTGSFSRTGTDVTLNRTGHYLAIYNSQFDRTDAANAARSEMQSYLTLNDLELPIGWSQGYIRRANSADQAVTAGVAVFSATATDILNLRTFRSDTNAGGTVQRAASGTALQLVKLDDANMSFAELSLGADAFGPSDPSFITVPYDTETLGSGFAHDAVGAPGELTLVDGGKYLVTANTYAGGPTSRQTLTQRLTLNGTEVPGSKTVVYLRVADGTGAGAVAIGMIIEAAPNDVLSVQGALGEAGDISDYIAGRCGLTVVRLPSGFGIAPEYIRLSSTTQSVNSASDAPIALSTQDETPATAFSHMSGDSAITVNTDGDYLFLGGIYDPDDNVTRAVYNQGWSINGSAREQAGQTARYTRNAADGTGIGIEFGNTSGLVASGLTANDTVEMVSRQLGNTGDLTADSIALQGVRLASLFVTEPFGVDTSVTTLAVSETTPTTSASFEMGLRSATTGTVGVTVTADADTLVSMDDSTFSSSVVLSFTDTTLQTVYVRAVDDTDVESTHQSVVSFEITTSDDPNFPTSLPILPVTVTVTDNDVVTVSAVDDASATNASEDAVATEAVLAPQTDVLENDTDGINNMVSAFDATSAGGAAVTVNADGTFTYDPAGGASLQSMAPGETFVDTFGYTAQDGDGNTDTATVSITVDGANDAPEASHDFLNDGPVENASSWVNTVDLTVNDGSFRSITTVVSFPPGSDLRLLPGKVATQSPSVGTPPGNGFPENAFDGMIGTFTHTQANNNTVDHSWQVDLGQVASLENITLANRNDCCGVRLRDITVRVLDAGGTEVFNSGSLNVGNVLNFDGGANETLFVDFAGPIMGQTVIVDRDTDEADTDAGNGSILSLSEVTIIGSVPGTYDLVDDFLLLNYDAGQSADIGRWENRGSSAGAAMDWLLTDVTLDSSPGSGRTGISGAYVWDDIADRARLIGTSDSIQDIMPGTDLEDATWEFWVKPDNASEVMTLFETGGGTGFGFIIYDGVLEAATGLDGSSLSGSYVSYDLVDDPSGLVGGDPTAEFNQYAVAISVGSGLRLYVNGVLVDESTTAAIDWDGGDGSGLGIWGEANHGGFQNTAAGTIYDAPFLGSMALVRLYSGALTGAQVLQNFQAVDSGVDIDGDSIGVTGVIDGDGTFVPNGTEATLASGALVTMNDAAGGFDYNPNGAFSAAPGAPVTDTFSYRVSDGNGATAEANVTVTITGVIDAVDDVLAVKEGQNRTFFANEIVGNDESSSGAAGSHVNLNPDSMAGTVWTNLGNLGATHNGTILGSVSAPELQSNFGALGSAVISGTLEDMDAISSADATIEVWFKPAPGQTGKSTVFETGGNGNGFSIVFDADTNSVTATVDGGDDATQLIQATATGVVTGEFNQLIVVYDKDGGLEVGAASGIFEDILNVYLNNDPAAAFDPTMDGTGTNLLGTADDWCGTDNSGINSVSGTSALDENFAGTIGEVGIVRAYARILTPAEMEENFDTVVQAISMVTSPTTPEGNAVTLNADGSVTIDYSAVSLMPNETLNDAFTYTISDGIVGSTTATANVVVSGYTSLEDWRMANGIALDGSEDLLDPESDGLVTLLEFAFGTDPNVSDNLPLMADGSVNGTPVALADLSGESFDALFVRRDDHGTSGSVTYTPEFSSDLVTFYDSAIAPVFVADSTDDAAYEVVSVSYPDPLPDGTKARFLRVRVDEVP